MSYFDEINYDRRVLGFAETLKKAYRGDFHARATLKEAAISTSDLPGLFSQVTNYQIQEEYALADEGQIWTKIAKRLTVPNFLPQSMIELGWDDNAFSDLLSVNGGIPTVAGTLPNVPEGTEYPTAFKLFSSQEQISTKKNGARVPVNFETFINDQWSVLANIPGELVRTARNSEDAAVSKVLAAVGGTGINTAYFNAGNKNLLKYGTNVAGKAALSRETLKAALIQANSFKAGPNSNRPVTFTKFAVVIPQALAATAEAIMSLPTSYTETVGTKTYNVVWNYGANFEFVVNPWLDTINGTNGDTAWYVVPYAGEGKRTALGLTFLEQFELPELRVHNDQGFLLAGGSVNPQHGSFRNDTWEIRIRHIYEEAALNGGIGTVASEGTAVPVI
jgi:hypothetical protein